MSNRYYNTAEDGIQPGKISRELREALNIGENDLPLWIYRMRALGYPPGWLKKAVVDTEDLFDTDSNKRKEPSEGPEYDYSKFIVYPGFNAPMPENCVDYHYYVNMPGMLEHQQLEYAKKHCKAYNPEGVKRLKVDDVQDGDESEQQEDEAGVSDSNIKSPSSDTKTGDEETPAETSITSGRDDSTLKDEIKFLQEGSPMPKQVQRVPLEKFAEGVVGEILNYENIPNSTGRFDSIRSLLNTSGGRKRQSNPIEQSSNGSEQTSAPTQTDPESPAST